MTTKFTPYCFADLRNVGLVGNKVSNNNSRNSQLVMVGN